MTYDYNTPDEGTLDWHIPLNDNFEQLEVDLQALDDRLAAIESQLESDPGSEDPPAADGSMLHGMTLLSQQAVRACERDFLGGRQLDFVTTTSNQTRIGEGVSRITFPRNELRSTFGDTDRRLLFIDFLQNGADGSEGYEQAAQGAYTDRYQAFGEELVSLGLDDCIIRLNGEFNFEWHSRHWVGIDAPDPQTGAEWFAQAFQHYVDTMDSIPGANFEYCFNPAVGGGGFDAQHIDLDWAWPGAEYVDTIGLDFYNQEWEDRRQDIQGFIDWSNAKGVPLSTPEYGIYQSARADTQVGSFDHVAWVQNVFEMFRQEDFAFQGYWNSGPTIFPRSESLVPAASDQWRDEVIAAIDARTA